MSEYNMEKVYVNKTQKRHIHTHVNQSNTLVYCRLAKKRGAQFIASVKSRNRWGGAFDGKIRACLYLYGMWLANAYSIHVENQISIGIFFCCSFIFFLPFFSFYIFFSVAEDLVRISVTNKYCCDGVQIAFGICVYIYCIRSVERMRK